MVQRDERHDDSFDQPQRRLSDRLVSRGTRLEVAAEEHDRIRPPGEGRFAWSSVSQFDDERIGRSPGNGHVRRATSMAGIEVQAGTDITRKSDDLIGAGGDRDPSDSIAVTPRSTAAGTQAELEPMMRTCDRRQPSDQRAHPLGRDWTQESKGDMQVFGSGPPCLTMAASHRRLVFVQGQRHQRRERQRDEEAPSSIRHQWPG